MKENQQILNGKISEHDSMVKSPVLARVKTQPNFFYQKDNIWYQQEFQKYITIIPQILPLRKASALRFAKYDLHGPNNQDTTIVRSSFRVRHL